MGAHQRTILIIGFVRLFLPLLLLVAHQPSAMAKPTDEIVPHLPVAIVQAVSLTLADDTSSTSDATASASDTSSDTATDIASDPDHNPYDLDRAETKGDHHAPKLEIIKQIRRLNSDGSYTVGYEADDGTFKIESRDVLGNVKGTYGYVDVNGEIKRVSYTAGTNASTASRMLSVKTVSDENAPPAGALLMRNRTAASTAASSTTRRPAALAYLTTASQSSPTRATVIQAIPKKTVRILQAPSERPAYNHHHHIASTPRQSNDLVSPSTSTPRKPAGGEPTTTVVYATSAPANRPSQQQSVAGGGGLISIRPTPLPGTYKTVEQLARPDKLEITDHVSKVQISSNRDQSTAKPVTELVDEKELSLNSAEEKRSTRGSFSLRPTAAANTAASASVSSDVHDEAAEAQQQVIYSQSAGDDSSHVYSHNPSTSGASSVTSRPIFAGTPTTRIPSAVLAARSRVAQLQNAINQQQLAKQQQNEKIYVKTPRRRPEAREDNADQLASAEPSSENQYVSAQRPATVQIVAPPPAGRGSDTASSSGDEEKRVYRRPVAFSQNVPQAYRTREFVRQAPPPSPDYEYSGGPRQFRIPIPQAYPQQQQQQSYQSDGRRVYAEQPQPQQQQLHRQVVVDDELPEQQQYLRETTVMSARPIVAAAASSSDAEYPGYRPRGGRQYLPFPGGPPTHHGHIDSEYDPYGPLQQQPQPHHQHQHQHNPYNPYRNRAPLPSQLFQHPDRPLTARDFERLLNLLVIRHQQLQHYQPQLPLHYQPYQQQHNQFGYQQQIPRPPVYNPYDPRLSGLIRPPLYGEFSDQDASYQSPPTTAGQRAGDAAVGGHPVEIGQRQVPRHQQQQKQRPIYYSGGERPEFTEATQPVVVQQQQQQLEQQHPIGEYLPADIREELLYRMLLLAMQPGQSGEAALEQSEASSPEYASLGTTTTKPLSPAAALTAKFRKPVRSVQILGEE